MRNGDHFHTKVVKCDYHFHVPCSVKFQPLNCIIILARAHMQIGLYAWNGTQPSKLAGVSYLNTGGHVWGVVVHGWAGAPHHDGGLGDHGDCHQSGSEHNTHGQTKGGGGKEERERERERVDWKALMQIQNFCITFSLSEFRISERISFNLASLTV